MPLFNRKSSTGSRRVVVLFVADTHAGNRLGLLNPQTTLYEQDESGEMVPYSPNLGKLQSRLWQWFTEDVSKVAALAGDDEIIYVHQGDAVQGHKHPTLHVGSGARSNQLLIAVANQIPILSLPNVRQARFVAGTAAHDGIGASEAIAVVQALKPAYPGIQFKVLYHGVLNIGGCRIDYAHHGPHPGSRKWLEGNSLLWYLRDIVLSEWNDHARIAPRVLTRAHQHTYRHVPYCSTINGKEHQFDAFLLPSWCGMQDFARQVTRSAMSQEFGLLAIEIVNGELKDAHPMIHTIDLRTEEEL